MRSEQAGDMHIVDQFQNDIKAVATMWHTMAGDDRLTMNDDEWERKLAMEKVISLGLAE